VVVTGVGMLAIMVLTMSSFVTGLLFVITCSGTVGAVGITGVGVLGITEVIASIIC